MLSLQEVPAGRASTHAMQRYAKSAIAAAIAALALAACSGGTAPVAPQTPMTSQDAAVLPGAHAQTIHTVVGTGIGTQASKTGENLFYHGGQVMTFPAIGLVYWGFGTTGDPDNEIPRLNSFMNHFRGSAPMNVVTQYFEIVNGQKYHVPNYPAMSIAIWKDDTDPLPGLTPTDKDVRNEAVTAAAHFNFGLPGVDKLIIVALPHGLHVNYAACAYHSWYFDGSSTTTYTNLPYQPDFGAGCGAYSVNTGPIGVLDGVTETAIHEIAESMTDPFGGGWLDKNGAEIGDKCQQYAANASFNGKNFPVQPLWSNLTGNCQY
jgi:hypothetical protein